MNIEAQAAMEFLMTYGWAILVVMVAVGALAYFGVLDPSKMLPESCTGPPGFDCIDRASANSLTGNVVLGLKNNQGFPVVVQNSVSATGDCQSPTIVDINGLPAPGPNAPGWPVNNNQNLVVNINCGGGLPSSGRGKIDVVLTITNSETGLNHDTHITANIVI